VSTLASIYVARLSNAYRHTYRARISDLTVPVLRKSKIPPNFPFPSWSGRFCPSGTLSRYHFQTASTWDWRRLRMWQHTLWPASHAPAPCAMPRYLQTGDDILTIFTGHHTIFVPIYLLSPSWITHISTCRDPVTLMEGSNYYNHNSRTVLTGMTPHKRQFLLSP